MRLQLRRKLFAFGDDFTVQDETGTDRYIVDGKIFTLGIEVINNVFLFGMLLATWNERPTPPKPVNSQ
jgi:hypothetical protein